MTESEPYLLSLDAAAARLGVCTRTVRRAISAGELKAYRVRGKSIRVKTSDVDALLTPIPTSAN